MDLTVSGKNILDEGFSGANVRDKENNNKFSKSGAEFLLENIKKATTPVENTGMRNKDAISSSISIIAQNLGDNTEAIQKIVDANDESQEEFVKLVKMMATAQEKTGEASVKAINQLLQQIAKIEIKSGDNSEELIKLLGLDITKETLSKQSNPLGFAGTAFKKFTNVDVRENDTFGGSLKQAFSKEKLFGLQPKIDFEAVENQTGQAAALGAAAEATVADSKETETSKITPAKKTAANAVITNAEGGNITSGIDRESLDNKKVELLEDILAELKNMSGNSEGGFGPPGMNLPRNLPRNGRPPTNTKPSRFSRFKRALGFADDVPVSNVADDVARAGTNVADDVVRGAASTTSRLGTAGKLLGKAAIPLTVGMGVYDGYTGYQDADQLVESGATNEETGQAFTEQDETAGKVEAVTSATGGVAGAIAGGSAGAGYGATAGAAIGSLFFGVGAAPGAAVGGFLGGAIGGTLGYFGGSKAGEMAGDAATTTSGEAALDSAIESGLYDKDWMGNSEINPEILKETTDTAQLQAILHDDDLDEKDTNRVLERLSQLNGGEETTTQEATPRRQQRTPKLPGVYEAGIRTKDADGNLIPLSEEEQSQVDAVRTASAMMRGETYTPSVSTNRNENSNAVDPKLKELNQKAASAEIAYNENPTEENYQAMADATLKSDEYILESNVPNANELVNMAPSDPSRMLMTGSDSASGLERIETSVTPTADAVGNMTEASASQASQQAPTVINNVTNNNTQASNSAPPVLINPTTARNSVNSFIDFQSRQYTRV